MIDLDAIDAAHAKAMDENWLAPAVATVVDSWHAIRDRIRELERENTRLRMMLESEVELRRGWEELSRKSDADTKLPGETEALDGKNLGYTGCRCNVCGYNDGLPFADANVCPACGAEFGYDDTAEYRRQWIESGRPWFARIADQPKGWNSLENLRKLTGEWK